MRRKRSKKGVTEQGSPEACAVPRAPDPEDVRHVPDLGDARIIERADALKVLNLSPTFTMEEANRALAEIMEGDASGSARFRAVQSYRRLEAEMLASRADESSARQPLSDAAEGPLSVASAAQSDAERSLEQLIEKARIEYANFAANEVTQTAIAERAAYRPIADALAVIQILMDNASLRERYCTAHNLMQDGRSSLNPMHPLVKGLFPKEHWSKRKGLISKHAEVLFALHDAGIHSEKVVQWLNDPKQSPGEGSTGYKKAERALAESARWNELKRNAKQERLKQRAVRDDDLLHRLRERKLIGQIEKCPNTEKLRDGISIGGLLIVDGRVQVFVLTDNHQRSIDTLHRLSDK